MANKEFINADSNRNGDSQVSDSQFIDSERDNVMLGFQNVMSKFLETQRVGHVRPWETQNVVQGQDAGGNCAQQMFRHVGIHVVIDMVIELWSNALARGVKHSAIQ